jgi:hypothetical protein
LINDRPARDNAFVRGEVKGPNPSLGASSVDAGKRMRVQVKLAIVVVEPAQLLNRRRDPSVAARLVFAW